MSTSTARVVAALAAAALLCACGDEPTGPPLSPDTPAGTWDAASVLGSALPSTIYLFDPYEEEGRVISVHLVVDSIRLRLTSAERYDQRIWYTEWEGDAGGPPHTIRHRWTLADFGIWARTGDALQLDSEWLENHRMTGTFDAETQSLAMLHGLSHGDPPVPFLYERAEEEAGARER